MSYYFFSSLASRDYELLNLEPMGSPMPVASESESLQSLGPALY